MHLLEVVFWLFFGATILWIACQFIRMFLPTHELPEPRGRTRHSAGGGSHADGNLGAYMSGSDSSGGDSSGGGDCGGGGDSSSGG
jgi:uncharacterized membrane protein YgcG